MSRCQAPPPIPFIKQYLVSKARLGKRRTWLILSHRVVAAVEERIAIHTFRA
jgi:hypothetical protein